MAVSVVKEGSFVRTCSHCQTVVSYVSSDITVHKYIKTVRQAYPRKPTKAYGAFYCVHCPVCSKPVEH